MPMKMPIENRLENDFQALPELLKLAALARPEHPAIRQNDTMITYGELDPLVDAIAATLQHEGLTPGQAVAICAASTVRYVALYMGIVRAGGIVAPLPITAKSAHLDAMLDNSQAQWLFLDQSCDQAWPEQRHHANLHRIAIDDSSVATPWSQWLRTGTEPEPYQPQPDTPFNLIYSSGTTGVPKGIVQPHGMRWSHTQRGWINGYRPDSVVITATPLYSNTTLVAVLPSLAIGATVIVMDKFDAQTFLELCHQYRATHTILVPIQYQRILDHPAFDQYDLTSFQCKTSTSAPFSPELMARALKHWPGKLIEIYGMTEGGGRCELHAHDHPDKLHTVGSVAPGSDIRIIDDEGNELPQGQSGEIVGRSAAMMNQYYRQPEQTRDAFWFSSDGHRFIRTGDVGRFDEDGFLILGDRKKDMLISGGFNIYPKDLEAELIEHPDVLECTVIGVASTRWGETPVGYVVLKPNSNLDENTLLQWVNARLGRMQRLSQIVFIDQLPRNPIGKVLKRELRDIFAQTYGVLHQDG